MSALFQEKLPSLRVHSKFGDCNFRKPSFNLLCCTIFTQFLNLAFTFAPHQYYFVKRFRNFCILTSDKLHTFYKLTQEFPRARHNRAIFPLIRILHELVDKFDRSHRNFPPEKHLSINFTKTPFKLRSDYIDFRTFLVNLSNSLSDLYRLNPDNPYELIRDILFQIDYAFCMSEVFLKFFTPLDEEFRAHTHYDHRISIINSQFSKFSTYLENRHATLQLTLSNSTTNPCKCQ